MSWIEKEAMRKVIREQERLHGLRGLGWVEMAMDKLPTLTPPSEWVSVEKLPELNGEYIVVVCDEGEPADERIWGDTVVTTADYYDGWWTWFDDNGVEYDITDIVTHWMDFPSPPDRRPPEEGESP